MPVGILPPPDERWKDRTPGPSTQGAPGLRFSACKAKL